MPLRSAAPFLPKHTVSNATMSRIHPGPYVAGDAGHNVGDAILADPAG